MGIGSKAKPGNYIINQRKRLDLPYRKPNLIENGKILSDKRWGRA